MKTFLSFLVLVLALAAPAFSELIWVQEGDYYVDPPQGWAFIQDVKPGHFVMADPTHAIVLEVFSSPVGAGDTLGSKATALKAKLNLVGDETTFTWDGGDTWIMSFTYKAKDDDAQGWALITRKGDDWVSATAHAPISEYDKDKDQVESALNSLALGSDGRREPGPINTLFVEGASKPQTDKAVLTGLPTPYTMAYSLDRDEMVQLTINRETRLLTAQIGTQVTDQNTVAPGWTRYYRQIYRELYSSLKPLSAYWKAQVDAGKVTAAALPQTVLSWLQKFEYFQKTGLTSIATPWQVLKTNKGNCDSRSLVYLALMDQLGIGGILMVSAPYSHGMAALDVPGDGARFPFEDKKWIVAELTTTVALGMIAKEKADPNQWIGMDLWGKP